MISLVTSVSIDFLPVLVDSILLHKSRDPIEKKLHDTNIQRI